MTEAQWLQKVEPLVDILCDLDEHGTPKVKLPNCPKCGQDELGVVHANLMLCYACGWKIEVSQKDHK